LLFVTAKRGGYLADVVIAIYESDQSSPILQLTAEGPMCLMSTPKGNFRIDAIYGGNRRSVRVAADSRPAQVVFGFPDEPWDGIKASEDEKQQAR
jgi:hypothetical protein